VQNIGQNAQIAADAHADLRHLARRSTRSGGWSSGLQAG
jgi:hypothetical protein